MSSITEGLGSAILEAMACRRPVVATRAGGIPEAVDHEVTGLVVPPQDENALAAAILRLLKSPSLCDQYGQAGRQRVVDSFSVDRLVQGTAEVYERWNAANVPHEGAKS
jgi:glycosyltransferase involved in cell wall biosynthesis